MSNRRISPLSLGLFLSLFPFGLAHGADYFRVETVAGQKKPDGVAPTSSFLQTPEGLAFDPAGNLYIVESNGGAVRKVSAGLITTAVGNGVRAATSGVYLAANSGLVNPLDVTFDSTGNMFVGDAGNCTVDRVDAITNILTIYAGTPGQCGNAGNNGLATSATLGLPRGLAADAGGNLYVADAGNGLVWRVDATSLKITIFAGTGGSFSGDGGLATAAGIGVPFSLAFDSGGNLYIGGSARIRRVDTSGKISTYAGTGTTAFNGDGLVATSTNLGSVRGMAFDGANNLYYTDTSQLRVRRIDISTKLVTTLAGNGGFGYSGDGGPATSAKFTRVEGIVIDGGGNLYVADWAGNMVRKITPGSPGTISAYAGSPGPDNVSPTAAFLNLPSSVGVDSAGNVLIADSLFNRIRKTNAGLSNLQTFAGIGFPGSLGDGAAATAASLDTPSGVATDAAGNTYVADSTNCVVRKINISGTISLFAGTYGNCSFGGDGAAATSAQLYYPEAVAVDSNNVVYIADSLNNRIRAVSGGTISTFAGTGTAGTSPDGTVATAAQLNSPSQLSIDGANNLYIADSGNNAVRKVLASNKEIFTVAGKPGLAAGYLGDGNSATAALLNSPSGVAVATNGDVYIADSGNNAIRKVLAATGTIETIAGTTAGYSGDGGSALTAQFNGPSGIALAASGQLLVADTGNNVIRRLTQQYQLTVTANPSGEGTVSGTGLYDAGSSAMVSATPNAGYTFTGFSEGATATTSPVSVVMNGPVSVVAGFSCMVNFTPSSASPGPAGGSGLSLSFTVTPSSCAWTATSNAGWLTLPGTTSGTGSGSVTYNVAANTTGPRTGAITVGGVAFMVNQSSSTLAITTAANLGTWQLGTTQIALSATGGSGNYTWSVVSGSSLPPGLNIGVLPQVTAPGGGPQIGLEGVATTASATPYSFTLSVNDGINTVTQTFSLKITALTLKDNYNLPPAFAGTAYSHTFTPLNNAGTVTFSNPQNLPAGMTLSSGGVLSGTAAAGTYNISLSFTDGVDSQGRGFFLPVYAVNLTTPAVLGAVTVGASYSQTLTASGGSGGYQYFANSLPSGLSLNSSTGVISGTVSGGSGPFKFQATVTDSSNHSYTKQMMIPVVSGDILGSIGPYSYTGSRLDDAVVGDQYSQGIGICCGGKAPFIWTASGLPAGMSIRSGTGNEQSYIQAGDAELYGVPTVPGNYTMTVTATDQNGISVTQNLPFRVSVLDLEPYLPNGTLGSPYNATVYVLGGSPSYSATLIGGQPASGITMNTSALGTNPTFTVSGTPVENANNFAMEFQVSDGNGKLLQRNFGFQILGPTGGITINNNWNLGQISTGNGYSDQLSACCVASTVWSVMSGNLPPGLGLSSSGFLSGTPTASGTYSFLVQAADAANTAASGFRLFTLTVSQINITTGSLAYGIINTAYSASLAATGGTGTLTWSLATANDLLPPGIVLNSNGTFSGTPTVTGEFSFNVTVADTGGHSASRYFTIDVYTPSGPPLFITTGSNFGTWTLGTIQIGLNATGGTGTYTWSVAAGSSLPPGLHIGVVPQTNGGGQPAIVGVATTANSTPYSFTLSATSGTTTVSQAFTLKVTALTIKDDYSLPPAFVGSAFSYTLTALNNQGTVTYTPTTVGSISLNSAGLLSGTPTAAGNYTINVIATDGTDTVYRSYYLTVYTVNISTPGVLANATQGSAYSQTLTATGGAGGYTFTGNGFPQGLSLSSSGTISGTVTSGPGKSNFSITVKDTNGASYSKQMSITVVGTTLAEITPYGQAGSWDDAVVGDEYNNGVSVCCGGTPPFTWSASGLPAGITLRSGTGNEVSYISAGDAEIWGVGTVPGNYNVTLTVTDKNGLVATRILPLRVSVLDIEQFLPGGTIATPYSATQYVLGGSPSYSLTQSGGLPPAGLTLNTSTLGTNPSFTVTGTPLENSNNSFSMVYYVTDGSGNQLQRTNYFNIGNSGGISINNNGNLGQIVSGSSYSNQLSACCVSSYTWSLVSGSLPTGITLSTGGLLSGSSTVAGTYTFLVKASDTANVAAAGYRQFTLTVIALNITGSVGNAIINTAYSATLTATGGTGTLTWSLATANDTLPPGIILNSNGTFTGTPTATGQFPFNITVTDTASHSATRFFSINVYGPGGPPVTITTGSSFGTWALGTLQLELDATGGTGGFTWSVASGSTLPPGLALRTDLASFFSSNASAGLIGVLTTPGSYSFTLNAASGTNMVSKTFTMTVISLNVMDPNLQDAFVGSGYSYQFTPIGQALNSSVVFTPSASPFPSWLTLSSAGLLTGTPPSAGTYQVAFSITDGTSTNSLQFGVTAYAVHFTTAGVLSNGIQGSSYNQTLAAAGGAGGYTYTLSGGLPGGLSLSSAGVISGTITGGNGLYTFAVIATDTNNASYTKQFSIDVVGPVGLTTLPRIQWYIPDDLTVGNRQSIRINNCCGGTGPFTWSASGLPPGLSIRQGSAMSSYDAPGEVEIFGVPQTPGSYSAVLTLMDSAGASTSSTFPMNVKVLDETPGLPNATIGVAYTGTLRVLGGTVGYSAQFVDGEMPAGLALQTGTLTVSGTPTEDYNCCNSPVFRFADSGGNTLRRTISLGLNEGTSTIRINNNGFNSYNLGTVQINTSYSTTLSACCASPYVWALVSGTLPTGLILNSSSGVLSGTVTSAGTYTFLVSAANGSNIGYRQFTLTVSPLAITSSGTLPDGNLCCAYSYTFTTTGASGAVSWAVSFDTQLPPGLTLASSTGVLSGTPTSAGTYNFTLTATDTSNNTYTRTFNLSIYAAGTSRPVYLGTGPSLTWAIGSVETSLNASGGVAPYHYSLTPGAALVPGYRVLDGSPQAPYVNPVNGTGTFMGVGTAPGSWPTSIRVTDSATPPNTYDRAITLTVLPIELLDQSTLPKATVGTAFSYTVNPTNIPGTTVGSYTFAATGLPAGLTINSTTGAITGKPSSSGSFGITVTLGNSTVTGTFGFGFTLQVNPFDVTIPSGTQQLPNGQVNVAYSQALTASGCGTGCTWSIYSGSLPGGFSINGSTGVISGTLTSTAGYDTSFGVQVVGSNGTAQKFFSLLIPPTAIAGLQITTAITTTTTIGNAFSLGLNASGGTPPYTFTLQSGSLPPGIGILTTPEKYNATLSPGFPYLLGKPLQTGSSTFTLKVTDSVGLTATKTFTEVVSPLSLVYTSLPVSYTYTSPATISNPLTYNQPYSQQLLVVGGSGNYTSWGVSTGGQSVYPGLSMNASTGLVSGTPTNTGSLTQPVTVTDDASNSLTQNLTVNAASNSTVTISLGGPSSPTLIALGASSLYTLSPAGGTGPYTIAPVGTLPAGVQLVSNSSATASDTGGYGFQINTLAPGTVTFTLQATDANGVVGARTYTFTVLSFNSPLTTTLQDGSVGVAYSAQIYSLGSAAPTVTLAPGSALPPGLAISTAGLLSGTPTQAGFYTFNLNFQDAAGSIAYVFTLNITGMNITSPAVLPNAVGYVPYSYQFTVTGGSGITWSSTNLPSGLSLSSTGLLSGTLTAIQGRYSFNVTATSGGVSATQLFTLFSEAANSYPLDLNMNPSGRPDYPTGASAGDAVVNENYTATIYPDGGVPPFTANLAAGSSLPPGLQILYGSNLPQGTAPGGVEIAGVPTVAGRYTFTVIVTDSVGAQVSRTYALNVTPLILANGGPRNATTGVAYSEQLSASGGTGPYSFMIAPPSPGIADALPPGLTMSSTGLISGTPTGTGSFSPWIIVTDSASPANTYTREVSLLSTNANGLWVSSPGNNSYFAQPDSYASSLQTSGGTSTYTWSIASGTVPPGTTVRNGANPALLYDEGTPGVYQFTVRATDNNNASNVADRLITYTISPHQLVSPPWGAIFTPFLPAGAVGTAYSFTYQVAGGTPPYSFTESPYYPLPPGLTLSSAGVLSGTPTQSGAFNIRPVITDAQGKVTLATSDSIAVTPAGGIAPLSIAPGGFGGYIDNASVGTLYATALDRYVQYGTPPYTWTVTAGSSLPAGLSILAGSTAPPNYRISSYLTGVPTAPGQVSFSLTATDANSQTISVPFNLTISNLTLAGAIPPGIVGTPYTTTLTASGGTGPYTFTYAYGGAPGIITSAGTLSGTPTEAGIYVVSVTVTDSASNTLTQNYEMVVDNAAGQAPAFSLSPAAINATFTQGASGSIPLSIHLTSGSGFVEKSLGLTGSLVTIAGLTVSTATPGTFTGLVAVEAPQAAIPNAVIPVTYTLTAVAPSVDIDVPSANAMLSGTTTISGWALESIASAGPNAVTSVTVFVDGSQVGTATYGSSRTDVCGALPGRPGCPNVGWSYNLNVSALTAGSHTLKIVAADSAGNTGSNQVTFMTTGVLPYVDIDIPAANATMSGVTTISGWALEGLNAAGPNAISSVGIFVDGTQVGTATYGSSRSDVCGSLSGRPGCPNVGWSYNLNVSALTIGSHTLKVVATDSVGGTGSNQVTFTTAVASQTIVFDPIPNQSFGVSPFAIAAEATSGLPVTFASNTPAVCKAASNLVTLLSAGPCTITTGQGGNTGYSAASPVMRTFNVTQAKASGGFAPSAGSPFATGASRFAAIGDFNGDGVPDMAVANSSGSNAAVLLGNGMGGFTAATGSPFATGTNPFAVVVGDFNGDGLLDIATANSGSNNVTILLGNGSGGFTAAANSPLAVGTFPQSLAVGDFNGDGIQDLAVGNNGNNVTVLLGNGSGGFTAATGSPFAAGTTPFSIAVADFNGDGAQDLAVANYGSNNVTVLLGNGSGGFTAATGSPFSVGSGPHFVIAADFNGDGKEDLATANYHDNNVTVLLGNGSGGFSAAGSSPFAAGTGPFSLVAGDFNGDSVPDLAVANVNSNNLTLLLGNGSGGFAPSATSPVAVGSGPAFVTVGDFNGDGVLDLAAANNGDSTVSVMLGIAITSPYVNIDAPAPNATLSGTTTISGWALEGLSAVGPNAITAVTIQVDSNTPVAATYGGSRTDVCGALPGRPGCPNVGWTYNLNTSLLAGGTHTLKVVATDSAANTGSSQVTITTLGVPPWVNIDAPGPGATLSGTATISGWALEGLNAAGLNAISSVTVQVDSGTPVAATYGGSRTDVCGSLPGRPGCPNVGWTYNVNTSLLVAGSHTLKVTATDSANNTGSAQITVTTLGVLPWVNIDTPSANAALTGTTTVSGWALEGLNAAGPNAITSVTVQVDSNTPAAASYGSNRSDVCGSLPGRPGCPNVGWSYSLNTSLLAAGSHTLKVTATDSANNTGSAQVSFTTAGVLPWVNIDVPSANGTLSGTSTVSGWALEGLSAVGPNAISSVTVQVDNNTAVAATYGISRTDVCGALTGRPGCPNVGWSYNLNTSLLAAGSHTLKVTATDSANNTGSSQVTFTTLGVLPWVDIDAPTAGATLSGTTTISGWTLEGLSAAGPNAISTVTVQVDSGTPVAATYGSNRSDVCASLTGRPGCPNVGWSYNLNTSLLAAGSHTLKVTATDTVGNTGSAQVTFLTLGVLPWVDIDAPTAGATLSGTTAISGWTLEGLNAAGPNAIASVAVLVDGTQVGTATYGSNRSDVCASLTGRPGCPNVGWTYNLNVNGLAAGSHTLKVVATDTAAVSGSSQVTFMVAAIVPWVDIDAPAAGATLSGTTAISGWALEGLNAAGPNAISTVAVLVDGTQVGTATYGSNRSDVCGALTGRPGCPNVGWSYNLNVTSLSAGSHTLKVVATDTASVSGSNQVTFLVAAITPWVDIDVPFAGATLSGTTTISGWALEGLNAAGPNAIASVAVLVDGTQVGTATYGSNRSDVCSALTGRPGCPNVGWTYNLNVSALTAGSHTLEILATDTVGLMGSNQVSFTK